MRFPSQDRFLQYVASKRRTYLRTLHERGDGRGFFALWKGEWEFANGAFSIDGLSPGQARALGRAARWLLAQDLVQVVRDVAPDFPPVPANVIEALPGALHQTRSVRSMLIAGGRGSGREQLAILLHVLTGRPALLVRVAGSELGRRAGAVGAADLPERGSVLVADVESTPPDGQAELLGFLVGEGRLRDLFVFTTTAADPRELAGRFGIPRDLLMRTGQAEVRLAPLAGPVAQAHLEDLVFDLSAVANDRLPALREEARDLAATWNAPGGRDLFEEAMSWLLWREKARLATATLADPAFARTRSEALAGDRESMRSRIAAHLGAREPRAHREGETRGARPIGRAAAAIAPRAEPTPGATSATTGGATRPAQESREGGSSGRPGDADATSTMVAGTTAATSAADSVPTAKAGGGPESAVAEVTDATDSCGEETARGVAAAGREDAPTSAGRGTPVPTSLGRDDLLRAYYEALLEEESGDLRRVAGRAGRKLRVLQAELERLGVRLQRGLPLAQARRIA